MNHSLILTVFPGIWIMLAGLCVFFGIIGVLVRPTWIHRYRLEPTEIRKQNLEGNPWKLILIAAIFVVLHLVSRYIL